MTSSIARREKAARLRRARGIPGFIPTTPIIRRIRALQQAGWTYPEIAAAAGVDRRTVHNIMTGYVAHVHQRTATTIVGLRPADAPNRVPGIGTCRRIQALALMGWPITWTGREVGMRGSQVNELMAGRRKRIPRAQAEAVKALFEKRWMTPGPSVQARTVALRNGWVPALAWDDIDNPDEKPQGLARKEGAA